MLTAEDHISVGDWPLWLQRIEHAGKLRLGPRLEESPSFQPEAPVFMPFPSVPPRLPHRLVPTRPTMLEHLLGKAGDIYEAITDATAFNSWLDTLNSETGRDPVWWTSSERWIRCPQWQRREAGDPAGSLRMNSSSKRFV